METQLHAPAFRSLQGGAKLLAIDQVPRALPSNKAGVLDMQAIMALCERTNTGFWQDMALKVSKQQAASSFEQPALGVTDTESCKMQQI